MKKRLYLHPVTERIWHMLHAIIIIGLIVSGAAIHWPEKAGNLLGNMRNAVYAHEGLGWFLVFDYLLWFFYNIFSGRVKHYIPQKGEIPGGAILQIKYYAYGIFVGAPHPISATENNKFNPLQKIAYFKTMFFMMPLLIATGIVFMYHKDLSSFIGMIGGIKWVAIVHTLVAYYFAAFLLAHLYLATTGSTPLDNYKSIITGWAEEEDHG